MKNIESKAELLDWDLYREVMKAGLKLLDGESPCWVSKDKLEFSIDGKPWKGHAFLAGKKGELSMKKLKKDGVIFREGLCRSEAKDLHLSELQPTKLMKETQKTFLKLRLGYKAHFAESEEAAGVEEPSAASGRATRQDKPVMDPGTRAKKLGELSKLESDLDRLLKALN